MNAQFIGWPSLCVSMYLYIYTTYLSELIQIIEKQTSARMIEMYRQTCRSFASIVAHFNEALIDA